MKRASVALLLAMLGTFAYGKGGSVDGPLKGVPALVVLQRSPVMGGRSDVPQDTNNPPVSRLIKLSPPTADGSATVLCCSQFAGFQAADIQSYDISFDARSLVFSGRLSRNDRYSLFVLTLNNLGEAAGAPETLTLDPNYDFVYPIFAPGERIIFVTNKNVEGDDVPQFRGEFEPGQTLQFGSVAVRGTDLLLAPRNLSHGVAPTMQGDGRVLFSERRRHNDHDAVQLATLNPDFTQLHVASGRERLELCGSIFKAQEVDPGRLVALCSSRDRTIQSGKILDIQLGSVVDGVHQSEAFSSFRDLTPLVPAGREPAGSGVGRYYDVVPIPGEAGSSGVDLFLIVSWADDPVEDELLGAAGLSPDFGIYLYDSRTGLRLPIFNDVGTWEVQPRILAPRRAPPPIESTSLNTFSATAGLLAGRTQRSSFGTMPDLAVGVQIVEGFSGEAGFIEFGLPESEGATLLGVARVQPDDSWAALIPPNIPVHLQPIDRFGMALRNEDLWQSVGPGDSAVCGGCHEGRSEAEILQPGMVQALTQRPVELNIVRDPRGLASIAQPARPVLPERTAKAYSWIRHLEPVLVAAQCHRCHDGTSKIIEGRQANRSLTLTETATGVSYEYLFNLAPSSGAGDSYGYTFGDRFVSTYSASHLGLLGHVNDLEEMGIYAAGDLPRIMLPGNFRGSPLAKILNPQQLYPFDPDPAKRWRPNRPQHPMEFTRETLAAYGNPRTLSWDETLIMIRMADFGAQFYARGDAGRGVVQHPRP